MAGTGYDEKQSGQLLPLEHHYKPFFGQNICIKQRKLIFRFLEDKSCTKKSYFAECFTVYSAYQTKKTLETRRELRRAIVTIANLRYFRLLKLL